MENVKLSPPWDEYARKITMLFEKDKEIHIEYKENDNKLSIFVDNADKYEALTKLLPSEKDFGGHKLTIEIVPANVSEEQKDNRYYLKKLFYGNDAVAEIIDASIGTTGVTYIEFEKAVIQFWNDNIGDLHGNRTTVLEEIAREVFENKDGVFFCTSNGGWEPF